MAESVALGFTILFVEADAAAAAALKTAFAAVPEALGSVDVQHGRLEHITVSPGAVVVPGNSFGLMDGGFGWSVLLAHGSSVQKRVQQQIQLRHAGEQPIGSVVCAATDHGLPVLHAAVVRFPATGALTHTDSVYLAMRGVLAHVLDTNAAAASAALEDDPTAPEPLSLLVMPCFGTGEDAAMLSYEEAARQMALAWRHVYRYRRMDSFDWHHARQMQSEIIYGGNPMRSISKDHPIVGLASQLSTSRQVMQAAVYFILAFLLVLCLVVSGFLPVLT